MLICRSVPLKGPPGWTCTVWKSQIVYQMVAVIGGGFIAPSDMDVTPACADPAMNMKYLVTPLKREDEDMKWF